MQDLANRFTYDNGNLISKVTGKVSGTVNNWGYRRVSWDRGSLGRVREYAHRLVWFMHYGSIPDGVMVDHINLNKDDNRIENLRLIDKSGNAQNSKCKGYCLDKRNNKYVAYIKIDGVSKHLGYYDKVSDARKAYLKAKRVLHTHASEHVLK